MLYPTSSRQHPLPPLLVRLALLAILILATSRPCAAQWRVAGWLGDAAQLPTPVTFSQVGTPDISATGHWSTRPWAPTWYYGGEISHWTGHTGWGLTYMHHKMYMDNPPPDVQYFRVTNGVNFILAERLWATHGWEFGAGAGPVLTVPVSSIRGAVYDNAHGIFHSVYELGGVGASAGVTRRLRLLPFTYGLLSIKATAAYLHVNIADGHAVTTDFALHVQYGLSLQSRSR